MRVRLYMAKPDEFHENLEKALREYAESQQGGIVCFDVRSLLAFMKRRGYPLMESEGSMRNIVNGFYSSVFGPLWDGAKYRRIHHANGNSSQGRSLLIGTDNVNDLLRKRSGAA